MTYRYPIALTQQFRFCGNAFRIDLYKGCNFGCHYCFANSRKGGYSSEFDAVDFSEIEKTFRKVDDGKESKNLIIEMLRHKVPLHLGGMSDPFQKREFEHRLTYKFLSLSKQRGYPVMISTKASGLPEEYWGVLDPKFHAFQISLMGTSPEFVRKYEKFSPSPDDRIRFMKQLRDRGFWVSVRIQPLIDLQEALLVIGKLNPIVNYMTVEHLKIPIDNVAVRNLFSEQMKSGDFYKPKQGRMFELKHEIKLRNIEEILKVAKVPVGVGDNDLHEYSQSRNCCGIDTINENFGAWMKYNYTYLCTGLLDSTEWIPSNDCRSVFNSADRVKGLKTVKEYVDYYMTHFQFSLFKDENDK